MTFKDLKEQYSVYIFDKNSVEIYQGKVIGVKPGKTNPQVIGGFILEFTIEFNGNTQVFAIPDHLSVTYTGGTNNLVLAVDKQSLNPEVEKYISEGERVLNNIDGIKAGIEKAKNLLMDINPIYKEKQQTEERFTRIEDSIADIKEMLQKLMN